MPSLFLKVLEKPVITMGIGTGIFFRNGWLKKSRTNIPNKSIIIMDNATYHNVLAEDSVPTPCQRKKLGRSLKPIKYRARMIV